jgi:hypothetical protein
MKRHTLLSTAALVAASLVTADAGPRDDATAAAKKLAEKSYSWKTSSENAGGGGGGGGGARGGFGSQEGKISADGTAMVTIPGRDNNTEAVIKGDKFAVKRGEGWQSASELSANADQGGGGGGRGRFAGALFRNFKAPAARALDLIGHTKELKSADGIISGDLTEEGAKSLLTFGGRGGGGGPEISGAKGSVKFWVKDGVLTKMETKVQGRMSFNGNDRDIDRTTTTEIKDIGTTTVNVPEDAKKKLS